METLPTRFADLAIGESFHLDGSQQIWRKISGSQSSADGKGFPWLTDPDCVVHPCQRQKPPGAALIAQPGQHGNAAYLALRISTEAGARTLRISAQDYGEDGSPEKDTTEAILRAIVDALTKS